MNEKERLIDLLWCIGREYDEYCDDSHEVGLSPMESFEEMAADHLLANGVIVPPCKVGDKIYWYNMGGKIVEADVKKIMYAARHPHGFEYDIGFEDFGKTVFLSREEAEKALKERSEGE